MWKVLRHSGFNNGEWRVRVQGIEQFARDKYDVIHRDLRQGGVRLVDPDGKTMKEDWAPRLRTRW